MDFFQIKTDAHQPADITRTSRSKFQIQTFCRSWEIPCRKITILITQPDTQLAEFNAPDQRWTVLMEMTNVTLSFDCAVYTFHEADANVAVLSVSCSAVKSYFTLCSGRRCVKAAPVAQWTRWNVVTTGALSEVQSLLYRAVCQTSASFIALVPSLSTSSVPPTSFVNVV